MTGHTTLLGDADKKPTEPSLLQELVSEEHSHDQLENTIVDLAHTLAEAQWEEMEANAQNGSRWLLPSRPERPTLKQALSSLYDPWWRQ